MKKIFFFLSIIVLIIIVSNAYFKYKNIHYIDKATIKDLFGQDVQYHLINFYDLDRFEIHGNDFFFYEFYLDSNSIKKLIQIDGLSNYPSYKNGIFTDKDYNGSSSSLYIKWGKTPIISQEDMFNYKATFGYNLGSETISDYCKKRNFYQCIRFANADYINKEGNYYSYISSTYLGHNFFILIPSENRLYLCINS